ncbi:MAG: hypothetical protein WCI04_02280 [archaeon]
MNIKKIILGKLSQFNINGNYFVSEHDHTYCPHVNGIVKLGLAELGVLKVIPVPSSDLFFPHLIDNSLGVFHKRVDTDGGVIQGEINACKNSVPVLTLAVLGKKQLAKKVLNFLFGSALYNSNNYLFYKEMDLISGNINKKLPSQSNLWAAFALFVLKDKRWKIILSAIEKEKLSKNGLFKSINCESNSKANAFFSDDQALATILYLLIGENEKAKKLAEAVLQSPLYDKKTGLFSTSFWGKKVDETKSTYKNGLCGIALGKVGFEKERKKLAKSMLALLYDKKEGLFNASNTSKTKFPDSNILALMVITYPKLKHLIF